MYILMKMRKITILHLIIHAVHIHTYSIVYSIHKIQFILVTFISIISYIAKSRQSTLYIPIFIHY